MHDSRDCRSPERIPRYGPLTTAIHSVKLGGVWKNKNVRTYRCVTRYLSCPLRQALRKHPVDRAVCQDLTARV